MKYLGIWDFIWVPIFLLLVHYIAGRTQSKYEDVDPAYKFYKRGFLAKIYGGLAFALVYTFYYEGGDTTAYWIDAGRLSTLIFTEPVCFFRILLGDLSNKWFYCFDLSNGTPIHYLRDPCVCGNEVYEHISFPICRQFSRCTILVAWVSLRRCVEALQSVL